AVPLAPVLVLGLTMVAGEVLGAPSPAASAGPAAPPARRGRVRLRADRRTLGAALVSLYAAVVVVNYVWLWPILTGLPITAARWQAEMWLPSWRCARCPCTAGSSSTPAAVNGWPISPT